MNPWIEGGVDIILGVVLFLVVFAIALYCSEGH